jgi:transcriptional regulator with XRE-family HTH domain
MKYSARAFQYKLKAARDFLGLSQSELARKVGMLPSHISHFESGRRYPSLPSLVKILNFFDVPPEMFLK